MELAKGFVVTVKRRKKMGRKRDKCLRRNTQLKTVKYYTFPIGKKLHVGFARATSNRGVKFIAYTLQSDLDKYDEKQVRTVLSGRLQKALATYKNGGRVRGNVQYAGVVPDHNCRPRRKLFGKE